MQNEHSANAGSAAISGVSRAESDYKTEAHSGALNGENRAPRAKESQSERDARLLGIPYRGMPDAPPVTAGGEPLPEVYRRDPREAIHGPNALETPEPPEPPIRTETFPLSKLPRCLVCHEYVGSTFKVVDIHLGIVNPRGAQHVAGLSMAHRLPLVLAEVFSAEPDPVNITADPRVDSRGFFCMECYALSDMPQVEEMMHRRAGENS